MHGPKGEQELCHHVHSRVRICGVVFKIEAFNAPHLTNFLFLSLKLFEAFHGCWSEVNMAMVIHSDRVWFFSGALQAGGHYSFAEGQCYCDHNIIFQCCFKNMRSKAV